MAFMTIAILNVFACLLWIPILIVSLEIFAAPARRTRANVEHPVARPRIAVRVPAHNEGHGCPDAEGYQNAACVLRPTRTCGR